MLIRTLALNNFKNAGEEELRFGDGINVICGENASGKTNLLEGIFYFASGKSFRGCRERDLIRFGEEAASAELGFETGGAEYRMGLRIAKNQKRQILIGGVPVRRLSEYLGLFRAVIFTPDHLNLVKGAPEFRRRFLDLAICQSFPRYAASLNEYNRILMQKNAMLKRENVDRELLAVYHERMAALAAVITTNRCKYIAALTGAAAEFQKEMSGDRELLTLKYVCQCGEPERASEELRKSYEALFEEKAAQEIRNGFCMYGPQKDDFSVYLNGKNARTFGSQGQQRSSVLSLKLAEGELSKRLTGEYPVFLLDDILSELDKGRREYILSSIKGKQVVLTGCEEELFSVEQMAEKIVVEHGVARNV